MPFVPVLEGVFARDEPLGASQLNILRANVREVELLRQIEHLASGKHNARETPWVIGRISGTTGYLFDTAYGGGTITQPATGTTAISVVSGVYPEVITPSAGLKWDAQALANVSDSDIANKPHIISVETISATEVRTYIKRLADALDAPGNTWEAVDRQHEVAVFAQKASDTPPTFEPFDNFVTGEYLYDTPERWQAIARDQHATKLRIIEHRDDGSHWTPRVAFAQGLCSPISGPDFELTDGDGVESIERISAGVVEVTTVLDLSSTNLGVCFPQGIPNDDFETVIINGRNTNIRTWRFYIYRFDPVELLWERVDRAFSFAIFGDTTE